MILVPVDQAKNTRGAADFTKPSRRRLHRQTAELRMRKLAEGSKRSRAEHRNADV
jgi:hypothetical protein